MSRTFVSSFMLGFTCLVMAGSSADAQQLVLSGPLGIQGEISADGDINANANVNLNGDNSVITSSDFSISQTYTAEKSGNVSGTASHTVELGYFDFCALTEVYIAGQDDKSTDIGECKVYPNTSSFWHLEARVGGNTDKVECSAICLKLPFAQPLQ